jgi:hypothetical protein
LTSTIRIKRRTTGAIGPPTALAAAELAFNETDNTLYYGAGNSAGQATQILAIGGVGSSQITISDTAPANPRVGNMWWDSVGGLMYMWYADPNSSQWVNVNNANKTAFGDTTNAGRNKLHNALFNIQQRGAGPWTSSGGVYTADRWRLYFGFGDSDNVTIIGAADADRAAIGDEEVINLLQNVFTGSAVANSSSIVFQNIEKLRRLANKTCTLSFFARASTGTPKLGLTWTQVFGTGGSPSANVQGTIGSTAALSVTWQRYVFTFTFGSSSGKTFGSNGDDYSQIGFWYTDQPNSSGSGIGVQSGTIQIWGVQLEIGSQVTPLEKLGPRDDLANCQRFYQTGAAFLKSYGVAGAALSGRMPFAVQMRSVPAMAVLSNGNSNLSSTSIAADYTSSFYYDGAITATGTGQWNFTWTASADL